MNILQFYITDNLSVTESIAGWTLARFPREGVKNPPVKGGIPQIHIMGKVPKKT